MDTESLAKTERILERVEGQVRGIRRLLAEGAYCCDVLQQLSAITSALNQVSAAVVASHVRTCILAHGQDSAHEATKSMSKEEVLDELDDVLSRLARG
jgi:hypothetical protein